MKFTSTSKTPSTEPIVKLSKHHLNLLYQLCSRLNFFISAYTALAASLIPYLFSSVILSYQQPRHHSYDTSFESFATNINNNGISCSARDQSRRSIFDYISKESIPWTAWLIPVVFIFIPTIFIRSWTRMIEKSSSTSTSTVSKTTKTTTCATRCPYEKLKGWIFGLFLCPTGQVFRMNTKVNIDGENKPITVNIQTISQNNMQHQQQQQQQQFSRSKPLFNPKRVITSSLCLWIFLILSAPKLGLKNPLLFRVNSSRGVDGPNSIFSSQGSIGSDPMLTSPSFSGNNPIKAAPIVDANVDTKGNVPDVIPSIMNDEDLKRLVQEAEDDLVMDSEWVRTDDDDGIAVDGEEGEEEEQEYSGVPMPFSYDPFTYLEQESAQDDVIGFMSCNNYLGNEHEQLQQPNEHVPYWTNVMIILISLSIGGMISGRNLMHSQVQDIITELEKRLNKNRTVYSYIRNTVPFKMIIMGNLGFFMSLGWIILNGHNELFDLFFASIGLGLMVLTQKWVPDDLNTFLRMNSVRRSSYEVQTDIDFDLEKDTKTLEL